MSLMIRSCSGGSVARLADRRVSDRRDPPFAPPDGSPMRAHFQVIHIESALTSSAVTSGW
jgi:hypothetical protein